VTPEDDSLDPASSPLELRASDRDREAALELLSVAAGDGRLTLEEYSGRAELALNARLQRELAELTADLERAVPDTSPVEPAEITAILGNESRKGHWHVPAHMTVRSVLGDCHLELQEAVLTSQHTTIDASATLGSITIFAPDGVDVRLSGRATLGSKSSQIHSAPAANAPVIEVRAKVLLGSVTVRPPKLRDRLRAALRESPAGRDLPRHSRDNQ
jgi:hypothetical protein